MASDWSGHITVKAIEAKAGYAVAGVNPEDGTGFVEILGDATLSRLSEELRQQFRLSLTIRGKSALQAKARATVWPRLFDEITASDNVIGIVSKADEDDRRAEVFVSASQFDRLVNNLSTRTTVMLYCRESTLSESDLVLSIHVYTTIIAP
ncbi:hypothetical protein ACVILK_005520 [Bradyrhizobium embrapense]